MPHFFNRFLSFLMTVTRFFGRSVRFFAEEEIVWLDYESIEGVIASRYRGRFGPVFIIVVSDVHLGRQFPV